MTVARLPFVPRRHQRDAHAKRKRWTVLVWHRRAGKTVFAVQELILAAMKLPLERGRFAYLAPQLKQAKTVAWDYLKSLTAPIPGRVVNEADLSVRVPNAAGSTSEIRLFGADNPDSLRGGYFDGLVLDEVAQMKANVWTEVLRPALADREGWALFIGTPKGVNLFSKVYFDALKDDEWHADMRRASETGAVSDSELEAARKTMPPAFYAQEFECDFQAAVPNAVIKIETALNAARRSIRPEVYQYAPKLIGVDVARYGDDFNAIAKRQGPVSFPIKKFRLERGVNDLMTVVGAVARECKDWKPDAVFVDVGGVGAGVAARLRELGWPVIDVDFGGSAIDPRFLRKRTEIWALMAEWLETAVIHDDNDMIGQLCAPTYDWDTKTNKMVLESKDEMRDRGLPSPDMADALACTFAQPVAMRDVPGLKLAANNREAETDFDPYAAMGGPA